MIPRQITPRHLLLAALVISLAFGSLGSAGCPKKDDSPPDLAKSIEKIEEKLSQVNNGLNALAKTNRELYRQNVTNLQERQTVARAINVTNSWLARAIDRAYEIDPSKPATIELGKIDVMKLLNEAINVLRTTNIGNTEMRIAAEAIIAIINEAVDLTRRVRALT